MSGLGCFRDNRVWVGFTHTPLPSSPPQHHLSTSSLSISHQPLTWPTKSLHISHLLKKLLYKHLYLICPPHFQFHLSSSLIPCHSSIACPISHQVFMWATRSFHIWNHLKNSLQNQVSPYCPPHFQFSPSHPSNLHLPTYNLSISHQLLIWATRSFQIQIQLGNLFQNQVQLLCPHHFQSHPPIAQILY